MKKIEKSLVLKLDDKLRNKALSGNVLSMKDSKSEEIDEKNQTSFEEVQKQSEKERKRIPWEILLMFAAILMGIYHFIGE